MSSAVRAAHLLLGLALLALPASGQVASLVADLNTTPIDGSSEPSDFHALGNRVVFLATEPSSGRGLWVTDGASGVTELLVGRCRNCSDPFPLTRIGPLLYFQFQQTPLGDSELWRTDGTPEGTFALLPLDSFVSWAAVAGRLFVACRFDCGLAVTDGTPGGTTVLPIPAPGELEPYAPTALGDHVVFAAETSGRHSLWITDGTPGGMQLLSDDVEPRLLTGAGRRVYFVSDTPDGPELWTSDGTPAGTRPLTSFPNSNPFRDTPFLKPAGNRVYFIADDVVHGSELWVSDGTPAGTRPVTDFGYDQPFAAGEFEPLDLEVLGRRVIFLASDGFSGLRLWASDGTPASTRPLLPGDCPRDCRLSMTPLGGKVLFALGGGLWASDGTPAGTRLLRGCPGGCPSLPADAELTLFRGAAWFQGSGGLWRTNGTPRGTRRFAAVDLGFGPPDLAALGATVYFEGSDARGLEPWRSDGTAAGTSRVADIYGSEDGSEPYGLTAFDDGRLAFAACDGTSRRAWQTAGTAESTLALTVGDPLASCKERQAIHLQTVGDRLFVLDRFAAEPAVQVIDGAGARPVTDPEADHSFLGPLARYRQGVAFALFAPAGQQVWISDGTAAGTRALATLPDDVGVVRDLLALGDQLYVTTESTGRTTLFRAGPAGLLRIAAPPFIQGPLVRLGNRLVFQSGDGLWSTDGTPEGTAAVWSPEPGFGFGSTPLVVQGGAVYFLGRAPDFQSALFRSDGTAGGTVEVRRFARVSSPQEEAIAAAAGKVFFAVDDGVHGFELWSSDGTPAGTVLVRDIVPGPLSSLPAALQEAGGRLFFRADDGVHGAELWTSDGSAAGTRLVHDLAPGLPSSAPDLLTPVGGRLYWTADDGALGRELWSLPLGGAPCRDGATSLCLAGRYQVEVAWRDFGGGTGRGQAAPLTADTGTFWFFDPANVELIVKVLDGRGLNGHVWVFAGALSTVEYTLTVTDTATGASRRYVNPAGRLASFGDTRAFGPLGSASTTLEAAGSAPAPSRTPARRTAATSPCVPGPARLCLFDGRFAVEARWKDFQGGTGAATGIPLTRDSGYFWFFGPDNVEVVVKVVDGRGLNGKFWLFYGALSNVEYTLTVTDTATGAERTYTNPSGRFASRADTAAF